MRGTDDFVYLDPPYAPLSGTARFTSYTADGFGDFEQEALQRAVIVIASRGASVLLSNSAAPQIRALYARHRGARSAGLRATTVAARRAINSQRRRPGPDSRIPHHERRAPLVIEMDGGSQDPPT